MNSKKKNETAPEEPTQEAQPDIIEQTAEAAPQPETEEAAAPAPTAEEELRAEKDRYLRLAAEYDNFRKRSQKEREAVYADVRADTVLKFLPVYDNLARALAAETTDEAYRRGVEMTMTQLTGILEKLGVTPIEAVGQTFDPGMHNAVMHIEDAQYGEGEIIAEFEKGFKLGERVIRFSMVQVAN